MQDDKQITITAEKLRAVGIRDTAGANRNMESLAKMFGRSGFLRDIVSSLAIAADPDMALNNLERFAGSLADIPQFADVCRTAPVVLQRLIVVFGASRFLASYLISDADFVLDRFPDPDYLSRPPGKEALSHRLMHLSSGADDEKTFYRCLRIFRKQEMLRIGLRDLLGRADLPETVSDLSDLAEVCLQRAYEWIVSDLQKRYGRPKSATADGKTEDAGFAVIAMGKLGGGELNFSSDVDLMYVYTADGETEGAEQPDGGRAGRITNHEFFIKLAERLTAAIGRKTEDGFVFRVDLRLRPEGQRGPLAQSLGGYEIYYESWGQTWERSALIKARPVAGDAAAGREFVERITPFVYRKYLDFGAIAEIGDMKRKINLDVEQKGRTHRDVKLGYGGIREIEFVIQALQMIYGGRDRSLRERSSLKALHRLSQKGLITYEEHDVLSKAYVFLRTVEHRIQILDDLQTQTMPQDEQGLRTLARRAGYRKEGREADRLLRDYSDHTDKVRNIYDELFAFRGEEPAHPDPESGYTRLLDPETTEQEAGKMLAGLGFLDPDKAYRNIQLLREGPAFVHQTPRSRRLFEEIFPVLFREIVSSPDPDMALNHFESFLASQGSWEVFQSLVRLDASSVKILIAVFANSEYLSRLLVSRPEFLQNMFESRKGAGPGTYKRYSQELDGAMKGAADLSEKLAVLRRFKHLEEIRIGLADLLSDVPYSVVSHELSKLAEVCLDTALTMAASETGKRYGNTGSVAGLAVIAAGKFGGRELTYGSDLDVFFVFSERRAATPPQGMTVFEYFSKVAEKTISFLSTLTREGYVFRMDTRLRPTGSKGPLAQSLSAFETHYDGQAETWELQALLRARCVAGDRIVGREFCSSIQALVYRNVDTEVLAGDILSMRKRMEEEVGRESNAFYNIKQGAGGIVDIEFLVQYLQLMYGKGHRRVRVPGTFSTIRALKRERLITAEEYAVLRQAYLFMRRLESRMRIISNQATSSLSRNPSEVSTLAKRMGYTGQGSLPGEQLLNDYTSFRSKVRALFLSVVSRR